MEEFRAPSAALTQGWCLSLANRKLAPFPGFFAVATILARSRTPVGMGQTGNAILLEGILPNQNE